MTYRAANNPTGAISVLLGFVVLAASAQDATGFRGYKTGRYEGEAVNATASATGRVVFHINKIAPDGGETMAHFSASGGLYGDAELKGQIDGSGVLKLTGMLSSFNMTVVGRVNGNTIKADYRLTNSNSSQSGTFTATFTGLEDQRKEALLKPGQFRGQECSYDAPAGTVSRTAKASEQLFKRVIYDWFILDVTGGVTAPMKVGITYLVFQMGSPFSNRVVINPGTGGAERLYPAAIGAPIYPVKTTYIHCASYRGSTERRVTQQNFTCFKNKDDDWVCPAESYPVNLEKTSIPN